MHQHSLQIIYLTIITLQQEMKRCHINHNFDMVCCKAQYQDHFFFKQYNQLYISLRSDQTYQFSKLMDCIDNIQTQMTNYCLITGPKTSKCNNKEYNVSLDEWLGLRLWSSVKNLGVLFDRNLSFKRHISSICKTMFFHIRNISKLQWKMAKKQIHASMTSRLNYCINVWMSCRFY